MKLHKLFVPMAMVVLMVMIAIPAHAGVKKAAKVAATAVADSNFVAAVTHSGPGFAFTPPVSLLFLATHDVYSLTSKLSLTVGVDVRSEYGFASSFSNLGIGGGFKYKVAGPFSVHAGYARTVVSNGPDSPSRVFLGLGVGRK